MLLIYENWIVYSVSFVDEDSDYYYFQSKLYSLSVFAITAEKNQVTKIVEGFTQETQTDNESVAGQDVSSQDAQLENPSIVELEINYLEIFLLIGLIGGLFYLESRTKKDEDKKD